MQMRPDIQIACMTKAMLDVVIPAVDSTNKLALEQSQLIVGMLTLMARQLPLQFSFDRDELKRLTGSAPRLESISIADEQAAAAKNRFLDGCTKAEEILEKCQIDPAVLLASIKELRRALGSIVSTLAEGSDESAQLEVEAAVLDLSREQLLRDRSLMVTQGFESDPAAIPSIESLLGLQPMES